MHLLRLPIGVASLEFSPEEKVLVITMLRAFGPVSVEHAVTYDVIRVGAERFTYLDEWEGPCLIAGSEAGTALLAALAREAGLSAAAE